MSRSIIRLMFCMATFLLIAANDVFGTAFTRTFLIDPQKSEIFCQPNIMPNTYGCDSSITYPITGTFRMVVGKKYIRPESSIVPMRNMEMQPVDFHAHIPQYLFPFPSFPVFYEEGGHFFGIDELPRPCGHGGPDCRSYTGSFDGVNLTLDGVDPFGIGPVFSYRYHIEGTVIPEPPHPGVVVIPAATGNGDFILEAKTPGCGFESVRTKTEGEIGLDPARDYPFGLVEVSLSCAEGVVEVTFSGTADLTGTAWMGCSDAFEHFCRVSLFRPDTVVAMYREVPLTYGLDVAISGSGQGTVTSASGQIDCPGTCTATYDAETSVLLTALPDPGFTFMGWKGGGCSGTEACLVTINDWISVTAEFALIWPLPGGKEVFSSHGIFSPQIVPVVSAARPLGVGPVAKGGTVLIMMIDIPQFAGPVDVFLATMAPDFDSRNIYMLNEGGFFQPYNGDLLPWIREVREPIRRMPLADLGYFLGVGLPFGHYLIGLLITPEGGDLNGPFYLWITDLDVR